MWALCSVLLTALLVSPPQSRPGSQHGNTWTLTATASMTSLIDSYLLTAPAKSHHVIETSDDDDDGDGDNEDSYVERLAASSTTSSVRLNTPGKHFMF